MRGSNSMAIRMAKLVYDRFSVWRVSDRHISFNWHRSSRYSRALYLVSLTKLY